MGAVQIQPWASLAEFAASLAVERDRLARLRVGGDPHLDVRVSFSASLPLLSSDEVDCFACLAACASDGFGVGSAAATAGVPEPVAAAHCARLYRLSLLSRPEGATTARFVFHPLLRDFVKELASERQLLDAAAERHALYFIAFAKANARYGVNLFDARVLAELDELLLAAEWMLKQRYVDMPFVTAISSLLEAGGYWHEGAELLRQFLQRGTDVTTSKKAMSALHPVPRRPLPRATQRGRKRKSNVYFREGRIPTELFSKLKVGMRCEADAVATPRGPEAVALRILVDS